MNNVWIESEEKDFCILGRHIYECSACGWRWHYGKTKYCPKCGARMETEEEYAQ